MQRWKFTGPKPPEGSDIWYRAEDRRYANYDPFAEFEQPSGSHLQIEIERYIVLKYTPKGVLLQNWLGGTFRVLGTAIRQHAVPTIELALLDLKARKEKHVRMSQVRLNQAQEHLKGVERCLKNMTDQDRCGPVKSVP